MATVSELITRVTDSSSGRPVIASLASPGKALGAASINIDSATNWTTGSPIYISIYQTQTIGGIAVKDPSTQTDWKGVLAGTTIGSLTLTGGTDRTYTAGAIVEQTATSRYAKDLYDFLTSFANTDGSLKAAPIQTALNLGAGSLNGWNVLGSSISAVTNNGNRSYDLTTLSDVTGTLSPGMRLQTTRTVAAPTQCTSLNGTTQYYSKTSPNGMTFTDDFTVSAWVKLSSYPTTNAVVISRTPVGQANGFDLLITNTGQVQATARNGAGNARFPMSYQSLPLNKWVHIAVTVDMSSYTSATNKVFIDGIDVPASLGTSGTNPTSLVQSGDLVVGAITGGTLLFPGKIAQAAVFSSILTQATIRGYMSQGLIGTETSLISAYSFNNSINDLNTTNANNLTANGSAVATNADSPFGGQAGGTISSTLDYGIVAKVTASTITVNVAEGCAIPTSGGVASVSYSTYKSPYGFPVQKTKWQILHITRALATIAPTINIWYNFSSLTAPLGEWQTYTKAVLEVNRTGSASGIVKMTLSSAASTESDALFTAAHYHASNVASIQQLITVGSTNQLSLSNSATYYMNALVDVSGVTAISFRGDIVPTLLYLENAYL